MQFLIPLGRVCITQSAFDRLHPEDVAKALMRHGTGDWGDLCDEDKAANDLAVLDGSRILSAYKDRQGAGFWIITEADRSVTTILLPEDY